MAAAGDIPVGAGSTCSSALGVQIVSMEDKMKPGTKDEVEGKVHEVKGKIKEKVGQLTDNPKLEALRQGWSGLDAQHARLAYSLALQAVDALYDNFGSDGVRNLMRNPERLAKVSAELDKRLGL